MLSLGSLYIIYCKIQIMRYNSAISFISSFDLSKFCIIYLSYMFQLVFELCRLWIFCAKTRARLILTRNVGSHQIFSSSPFRNFIFATLRLQARFLLIVTIKTRLVVVCLFVHIYNELIEETTMERKLIFCICMLHQCFY